MRLSPRAVLHFGAVWLAAVCRPAVAQLTDTQQVYEGLGRVPAIRELDGPASRIQVIELATLTLLRRGWFGVTSRENCASPSVGWPLMRSRSGVRIYLRMLAS